MTEAQLQALCWDAFCTRVRARLRVVVLMDPGERGSYAHAQAYTAAHAAALVVGPSGQPSAGSRPGTSTGTEPSTPSGGGSAASGGGGGGGAGFKGAVAFPEAPPLEQHMWRLGDAAFRRRLRDFPALYEVE